MHRGCTCPRKSGLPRGKLQRFALFHSQHHERKRIFGSTSGQYGQIGVRKHPQRLSQMATQSARAYRSHLQPACLACRRRKSRCHNEAAGTCLMCQAHGTDCVYPPNPRSSKETSRRKRGRQKDDSPNVASTAARGVTGNQQPVPVFDSPEDQQNLHIVGPAGASDSQVLSDYLARTPGTTHNAQSLVPVPASRSRSVFFTRVDKRPLGATVYYNPAAEKLEIVERIIEPWSRALVDVYVLCLNARSQYGVAYTATGTL